MGRLFKEVVAITIDGLSSFGIAGEAACANMSLQV
jgi:hypothetical protein